jgi:hypothetical protein
MSDYTAGNNHTDGSMHQQIFVYGVKPTGVPLLLATIDVKAESVDAGGYLIYCARESVIKSVTKFGGAENITHLLMQYVKPLGFHMLKEVWDLHGPRQAGQLQVEVDDGRTFYLVTQKRESALEFQV